ncbi:MAG: hypothetical protein HY665_04490 [Chloroflexi bacterium]|nr:hypothetical protein [Chloroflexota bacterium]
MNKKRLFTDEQLREMERPYLDLIEEAIDAGDKDRAKKLVRRFNDIALANQDMYVKWVTSDLSFIGRNFGDKAVEDALRAFFTPFMKEGARVFQGTDEDGIRLKLKALLTALKNHLVPVRITEDDEKFVLEMQPCGTGGRLINSKGYEDNYNLLKIKKPQAMTCGQADFPAYCAHGPVVAMVTTEMTGAPFFFEEPSTDLGKVPCKFYLYKNPMDAPEALYAKVGKKKKA